MIQDFLHPKKKIGIVIKAVIKCDCIVYFELLLATMQRAYAGSQPIPYRGVTGLFTEL